MRRFRTTVTAPKTAAVITAALTVVALAACGSPVADTSATSTSGSAGSSTTAPAAAAFPVTITHALGESVVPAQPTRVVTLGVTEGDIALSLGVIPVGINKSFSAPTGVEPWTQQALDDLGATTPTLIETTDGIPMEQVAALKPDLILAGTAFTIDTDYALLSAIAPTVPYVTSLYDDSWQQQALTIGQALGLDEQAAEVVATTEGKVADTIEDHPGLTGKTFTVSNFTTDKVRASNEPNGLLSQFFTGLGMTLSPQVAALPGTGGVADVSMEQMDVVDADIVIAWFFPEDVRATYEASPLYQQIPAVAAGRTFALDTTAVSALANANPLTIPYAIDQVLPGLLTSIE